MLVDSPGDFASKPYDYVVIGGGTAGLALAARLSEDPDATVAILEAGKNRIADPSILIPSLFADLSGHADYDWMFSSIPQEHIGGRQIFLPRGKVLGGCSAINGEVSVYPSKSDIDNWAALGNHGWSFDDLAPYYQKSQRYDAPSKQMAQYYGTDDIIDPDLHDNRGPIATSFPTTKRPGADAWVQTFDALGMKMTEDPQSGKGLGGFTNLRTIDAAATTRSYAATAYYAPNAGRPNLTLLTDAQVNKIILSTKGHHTHATAVSFTSKGSTYQVKANREVLLCAGAFQSPQILELSGIGSSEVLSSKGVDVKVENPNVGENLVDQPYVPLCYETIDGIQTINSIPPQGQRDAVLAQFYSNQTGILNAGIQSSAYLSLEQIGGDEAIHDLATTTSTMVTTTNKYSIPSLKKQFALQQAQLKDTSDTTTMAIAIDEISPLPTPPGVIPTFLPGNFMSIFSILCHPFSRGSVHISSSNPTTAPLIDYQYLSHPLDIKILAQMTLFLQDFATKEPMASFLKNGGKAFYPGYHTLGEDTVEQWSRDTLSTTHHPTGSCSMMPKALGGVVDHKLKVYGAANLRVVDASIFPMPIRCNPVATVYAVAEKAADIVKEDWRDANGGHGKGFKRGGRGEEEDGEKVHKRKRRSH